MVPEQEGCCPHNLSRPGCSALIEVITQGFPVLTKIPAVWLEIFVAYSLKAAC